MIFGQKLSNDLDLLNFIGVETECIDIPKKHNNNRMHFFNFSQSKALQTESDLAIEDESNTRGRIEYARRKTWKI